MLSFDLLNNDRVHSFKPDLSLLRSERFPNGLPQNTWEKALVHVQEEDFATQLLDIKTSDVFIILLYCAANVLLTKRSLLVKPGRLDDWYMLLDDWVSPLLPQHNLGWWRTAYGIEWLHARAMQRTPMENIWFTGHYWPTLWSATNACNEANNCEGSHNIERWSFLGEQWHIQHWLCTTVEHDTWQATYTSGVASVVCVRHALDRTLLLDEPQRNAAWQSIPRALLAHSLLDWTLHAPENDHRVIPYVCRNLGVDSHDLSIRLDLARALNTSARSIVDSLTMDNTAWPLPESSDT